MKVRVLKYSDIPALLKMHEKAGYKFPFPDVASPLIEGENPQWNPLYLSKGVVEENGHILGAGFVKLTSEAMLILDHDSSAHELSRALTEIVLVGEAQTVKHGIGEWHTFVEDSNFANILKKHYGFQDAKGHVLYLGINNGKI